MKLIFFDECKPQPDSPFYHIGAVCLDESVAFDIEAEITQIAVEIFGDAQLSKNTEFHAKDLFRRGGNFSALTDDAYRIDVFYRFLKILSKPEVGLISVQINDSRLRVSQSAADIAFMFLCERANDLVRAFGSSSIGMLIGDRESDRMTERFSTDLSKYRATGTEFAFGRNIENLFESVHFTPSHLSRFLQLADIYAWLLQFMNKEKNLQNTRHVLLWNVIKSDDVNLWPSKYKEWPSSH
jgi:hypothetical protein